MTLGFLATGAEPLSDRSFVERDLRTLRGMGFSIVELDFETAARRGLDDVDVVFVEGGTCFYLLGRALATGFADVLAAAVRAGKPYVGMSGGALLVGPDLAPLAPMSREPRHEPTTGLGLVDFVVYPHYDDERRGAAYPRIVERYGNAFNLVPLTDRQALVVENGSARVVTSA